MRETPYTNRGSEITTPLDSDYKKILVPDENRILVDWFAGTFTNIECPQKVIEYLGLDVKLFTPRSKGANGYKQALACGNITILFDGQKNMGVHFSMSGDGCRQYETQFSDSPWLRLIGVIFSNNGNISRFDLAHDNVDKTLCLDLLEQSINSHEVRTRFKRGKKTEDMTFHDGDDAPCGKTLNLNKSRQSLVFIRFYDKAAQLGFSAHWVRAEIEFKGDRAVRACHALLDGMPAGELFFSTMNTYFSVINLDDSNKSRCSYKDWWSIWLQSANKIKLTVAKAVKKIEEVKQWLHKSIAPCLAMVKEHSGQAGFSDFIQDLIDGGKKRMSMKHEQILFNSNGMAVLGLPF